MSQVTTKTQFSSPKCFPEFGNVPLLIGGGVADRQQFPFPNLVITDLKMPVVDGLQLLQWMQSVPTCRSASSCKNAVVNNKDV